MKYSSELASDYSRKRAQYNETEQVVLDALNRVGVRNKRILDIGCGDGRYVRLMKELGAAQLTGVDVNERMIELAREKSTNDSDITFLVADGTSLPMKNKSVDLVFSNFVIHYFPSAKEIFTEINRVLKDKGVFVGTFNITDVAAGFDHLYNQPMPIRLGQGKDSIVIQNLIKSRQEIEEGIAASEFIIKSEQQLDHPNAVIDDAYPYKSHIQKKAVLMVLQKVRKPK